MKLVTVYRLLPDGTCEEFEHKDVVAVRLIDGCLVIDFADGDQVGYPLASLWAWEVTAA